MKKNLEKVLQLEELLLTKKKYELMGLEGDLKEIERKIQKVRQRMPSALLSRYDALSQTFPDVVTVVQDQVCQGCRERISRRLALQVERELSTLCCEHCGRFLIPTESVPQYIE